MSKEVKLTVSLSDICVVYTCAALVMGAVGSMAYKLGRAKARSEIVAILDRYFRSK